MKKIILFFLLFLIVQCTLRIEDCKCQFDTSKYTGYYFHPGGGPGYNRVINTEAINGYGINSLMLLPVFNSEFDTAIFRGLPNLTNGKIDRIMNKVSYMGYDSGQLVFSLVNIMNPFWVDTTRQAFLGKNNIFTGTNEFAKIIADTLVVDAITTAESFKVEYNGVVSAMFDAVLDTFYMPKLHIGSLSSSTHLNETSVTTNSLNANIINSDTIHPSSPLIMFADSTIFTGDILFDSTGKRNLGSYNNKGDSIFFVHGVVDTIGTNFIRIANGGKISTTTNSYLTFSSGLIDGSLSGGLMLSGAYGMYLTTIALQSKSNFNFDLIGYGAYSIYPMTMNISDGGYVSTTNRRKISIGYTTDSTAFLTTTSLGQFTNRPFNIYPGYDYGGNLGLYNQRWDTVNAKVFKGTKVLVDTLRVGNYVKIYEASNYTVIGIGSNGVLSSQIQPNASTYTNGVAAAPWLNVFTKSITLGIDSIGASKSDTIKAGKNTMIVNCGASNNDTVFVANIGVSDGFEFSVIKVDAQATYVVVVPKGGYTIGDFATSDSFTGKTGRTYILKNKNFYIKP